MSRNHCAPMSGAEKTGLHGRFAQREFDAAEVLLHNTQQVGEVAGTMRVRPPHGDHLVVPDAVAQQGSDTFDAGIECVRQLLIAGRGRRRFVGYQTDL